MNIRNGNGPRMAAHQCLPRARWNASRQPSQWTIFLKQNLQSSSTVLLELRRISASRSVHSIESQIKSLMKVHVDDVCPLPLLRSTAHEPWEDWTYKNVLSESSVTDGWWGSDCVGVCVLVWEPTAPWALRLPKWSSRADIWLPATYFHS